MAKYHKTQTITLLHVLTALLITFGPAQAKDWRSYTQRSYFPAYVKEITGLPPTLKAGKSVSWGNWKVVFGDSRPTATLAQCDQEWCPTITIKGLKCSNSVMGTRPCYMSLGNSLTHRDWCLIVVHKPNGKDSDATFNINCPRSLVLE